MKNENAPKLSGEVLKEITTSLKVKVSNMTSSKGNTIANQFEIVTVNGTLFQSYNSLIAFIPSASFLMNHRNEKIGVILDSTYWDYSKTTGKYRNMFLGETKAETQKKINSGEYILADLN